MITYDVKIRVWYKHTDQMGVVHHSNYICYYEEARSAFMRHIGTSYADMEARGVVMPILHVESDYRRSAYYDDELIVTATVSKLTPARIVFSYEVYRKDQEKPISTGYTVHALVNKEMKPINTKKLFPEM